jgi:imidazolonepropionase-like amidohydrolase
MPGCLEGYHATATQILNGVDHEELLAEFGKQASGVGNAFPESLIYYSSTNPAPIITMQNGQFSAVAAMAIENGKVLKTGTLDEVKAAAPSIVPTDLKNNCIVPGFVEPHVHIITSAMLEKFLVNCDPLHPPTGAHLREQLPIFRRRLRSYRKASGCLAMATTRPDWSLETDRSQI